MSLCHRLRLPASSCVTREGLRALDIHKESSLCVQSSAFSAAGARRIKLRLLLWTWWMCWVALGGKWPNSVLGLMIHDPLLCHAGLHLLYPLRINTSLISEYKEDVQVVSRKHFTLNNGMFGCSGDRLVVSSYWCSIGLLILRPPWSLRRFFMISKQFQNGISGV